MSNLEKPTDIIGIEILETNKKNNRYLSFPKSPPKADHKKAASPRIGPGFIVMGQTNVVFRGIEGLFSRRCLVFNIRERLTTKRSIELLIPKT
jgi:hypothetical protein